MNKQLLLLFLFIFSVQSAKAQWYINRTINVFDTTTVYLFDLEPYYTTSSPCLVGYKRDGKIVIPAKYDYTHGFCKKGIARVTIKSPEYKGEYPGWASGGYHTTGMMYDNDGLNGFIDTLGNTVIPIKYSALGALEMYDVVPYSIYIEEQGKRVEKYGLINIKGEIIVEPQYDLIYQYGTTLYEVNKLGDKGYEFLFYMDNSGSILKDGGKFDKVEVISRSYPFMFYVEHNGVACLLDIDLKPYISGIDIRLRNKKERLEIMLRSFYQTYSHIGDNLQKFHDKVLSETTEE